MVRIQLMDSSWAKVSDSAKDLVTRLLTVDENERISAEQCLAHPWVADRSLPARTHLSETVENIRRYNQRRQLKVLNVHFNERLGIFRATSSWR